MAGRLSTGMLIRLLYDTDSDHIDTMVKMVEKYDMVVSSVLKGWNGIDSKFAIKLLHLTCEWKSDRIRLPDRQSYVSLGARVKPTLSNMDRVILKYYEALWGHYSECFNANVSYILTVEKYKALDGK